jgi:hypothetical protein
MFLPTPKAAAFRGTSQDIVHGNTALMAHHAAAHAALAKALGGGAPAQPSFKAGIANMAAAHGVPLGEQDINGAIGSLTQMGRFTPPQGAALMAHRGPLQGPQGINTTADILKHAVRLKTGYGGPRPQMGAPPMGAPPMGAPPMGSPPMVQPQPRPM